MSWQLWLAITLARISAIWAWTQATGLRRCIRSIGATIGIACVAWFWPLGIWIIIGFQAGLLTPSKDGSNEPTE